MKQYFKDHFIGFQVFVVQHVDVCMFSNGKFKNVVALETSKDECPIGPGGSLNCSYTLRPVRGWFYII